MFDFKSPFIIADIGSSWRRFESPLKNKKCAIQHIEKAAECGVSAVKFQMFTSKELYGFKHGDDKYALPRKWLPELAKAAKRNHVEFMCTAFSDEGVKYVDKFVNYHKVASAEMQDCEIALAVSKTGKPVFVSCGAHTHKEIVQTQIDYTEVLKGGSFAFLECVASYPAPQSDYSLYMIGYHDVNCIGISDHTIGTNHQMLALAIGAYAKVFEKHFIMNECVDGNFPECPDDLFSADESWMQQYVYVLNRFWNASRKMEKPTKNESEMISTHNRRVVAIRNIKSGEKLILNENFGSFRATQATKGGSPRMVVEFAGRSAMKPIAKGQGITKGMLYN